MPALPAARAAGSPSPRP